MITIAGLKSLKTSSTLSLLDRSILEKLLISIDINPNKFLLKSSDPEIKEELKRKTDDAYEKGVFGAPSFIINNKLFWGQDRLEFAIHEANK